MYSNKKHTQSQFGSLPFVVQVLYDNCMQSSMRNCYLQPSCCSNDKINAPWSPRKGLFIRPNPCSVCHLIHCQQSSMPLCQACGQCQMWLTVPMSVQVFSKLDVLVQFLCVHCVFMHRFCVQVQLNCVNISSQFSHIHVSTTVNVNIVW